MADSTANDGPTIALRCASWNPDALRVERAIAADVEAVEHVLTPTGVVAPASGMRIRRPAGRSRPNRHEAGTGTLAPVRTQTETGTLAPVRTQTETGTRTPVRAQTETGTLAPVRTQTETGTLAVNLAGAAHLEGGQMLVVDVDRQASAFDWSVHGRTAPRSRASPFDF
jgi:hypothetical protein